MAGQFRILNRAAKIHRKPTIRGWPEPEVNMKVTGTALLLICAPLWVSAQGASPVPQDAGTVITPPAIREGAPHATVKASCPLAGSFYDGHVTFIAKSSALTLYVSTNEFIPHTRESMVLDGFQRTVAYHPSYGDDQGRRLLWFSLNNLSVGQAYQLWLKGADCSSSSGEVSYAASLQWGE